MEAALNWTGALVGILFWLATVALALMLLTWLFPRLERRNSDDRVATQRPLVRAPLPHAGHSEMPPVTIVETPAVAGMSVAQRAGYWSSNVRLILVLLLLWAAGAYLPAIFAPWLNQIRIWTGFPLAYFLGAQGAPLLFLADRKSVV